MGNWKLLEMGKAEMRAACGVSHSPSSTEESVGLNTPKQAVRVTPCAPGAWGTGTTARTE